MPVRKFCRVPGCTRFRLDDSNYCSFHREKWEAKDKEKEQRRWAENAKRRGNTSDPEKAKYYSSYRWRKESDDFIKQKGCCEICGRSDLRLQVHHQFPNHYQYWNDYDFWDKSRWLCVCASCHARITKDMHNVAEHTLRYRFDFRKQ